MRPIKTASVVLAVHLIVLAFFFFKPPGNYFMATCLSTLVVWSVVFSAKWRGRRIAIVAGCLFQLLFQQVLFHVWVSGQAGIWWPLLQFLSLQYVVVVRLSSSAGD
jgi:hypothetical protein